MHRHQNNFIRKYIYLLININFMIFYRTPLRSFQKINLVSATQNVILIYLNLNKLAQNSPTLTRFLPKIPHMRSRECFFLIMANGNEQSFFC